MAALLTTREAGARLGRTRAQMNGYVRRGTLPATKGAHGCLVIDPADLAQIVHHQPRMPAWELAPQTHVPCWCSDPSCQYLDIAPVCAACRASGLDRPIYRVRRRNICRACLVREQGR